MGTARAAADAAVYTTLCRQTRHWCRELPAPLDSRAERIGRQARTLDARVCELFVARAPAHMHCVGGMGGRACFVRSAATRCVHYPFGAVLLSRGPGVSFCKRLLRLLRIDGARDRETVFFVH